MSEDTDKSTADPSPNNPDYLLQTDPSSASSLPSVGGSRIKAVTSNNINAALQDTEMIPERPIEDLLDEIDTSVLDNPVE
jgi:hypothetical protein